MGSNNRALLVGDSNVIIFYKHLLVSFREVNKKNLLSGQFLIFLPKNLGK